MVTITTLFYSSQDCPESSPLASKQDVKASLDHLHHEDSLRVRRGLAPSPPESLELVPPLHQPSHISRALHRLLPEPGIPSSSFERPAPDHPSELRHHIPLEAFPSLQAKSGVPPLSSLGPKSCLHSSTTIRCSPHWTVRLPSRLVLYPQEPAWS